MKSGLLLSARTYRCTACGFEEDRDWNAARNLQTFPTESSPVVTHMAIGKTAALAVARLVKCAPGLHPAAV